MKHISVIRIVPWLPGLLWMIALSVISHLPGSALPHPLFQGSDKLFHFLAYSGLAVLFYLRIPLHQKFSHTPLNHRLAYVLGSGYAILDECHQIIVPMRDFSFFDMAANLCGLIIVYTILIRRFPAK